MSDAVHNIDNTIGTNISDALWGAGHLSNVAHDSDGPPMKLRACQRKGQLVTSSFANTIAKFVKSSSPLMLGRVGPKKMPKSENLRRIH